jgi:hypothetical protein
LSGQALADTAEQLAYLGLQLLLRATANAAVQESLTDETLLRQLYWLAVQPPSGRVLNAGLALLRRLSSSPLAASVGGYQGGAVMLLSVLLHTGRWVGVESGDVASRWECACGDSCKLHFVLCVLMQRDQQHDKRQGALHTTLELEWCHGVAQACVYFKHNLRAHPCPSCQAIAFPVY